MLMTWSYGVHMVSKPMTRIMAIDHYGNAELNYLRPQLKHKAKKPVTLTKYHKHEEKGFAMIEEVLI
jgi:hypothetical protein